MNENKEETKTPIIDMMQESTVRSFVEGALPAVLPMLEPLSQKLDEYLGDNEKIIIIRRSNSNSRATVLVLDTSKEFTVKGAEKKEDRVFSMKAKLDEEGNKVPIPVIYYFNTAEFVKELLSGKFTKEQK